MRVWDVNPGYLNRQSLLGEHREVHALAVILGGGKAGYAHHPETRRWRGHLTALAQRHRLLAAEMALRGYRHHSPLDVEDDGAGWPKIYVDLPADQLAILASKYAARDAGRIPLPRNAQELWAHHKYSIMARDPARYRRLGPRVARLHSEAEREGLARELTELLREPPPPGRLRNALLHMWGHVAGGEAGRDRAGRAASGDLLAEIQHRAMERNEPYLVHSTALGELAAWLDEGTG